MFDYGHVKQVSRSLNTIISVFQYINLILYIIYSFLLYSKKDFTGLYCGCPLKKKKHFCSSL